MLHWLCWLIIQGVQVVADPHEEYIGATCAGILNSEIYIPSNAIDPAFAPYLHPYVAQVCVLCIISDISIYVSVYIY